MDLKKTLQSAGKTGYWLAKQIGRHPAQIYRYTSGASKMSPMMEDVVRQFLTDNNIKIIK